MIQGTYIKIPETGDRGSTAHPAISSNFEILDDHKHDGVTSALIDAKALTKGNVALLTAGWSASSGDYRQLVTLPTGYTFDTSLFKFIIASGSDAGDEITPTIVKVSSTTFYVYVYANTFDLNVVVC